MAKDTPRTAATPTGWPTWARRLASAAIAFHLAAIAAASLAPAPSSDLQRAAAGLFSPYLQTIDQGYSYRYYTNGPPPTPILWATLRDRDGNERELRIPDRNLAPRLLYQRHLALAYHLFDDSRRARAAGAEPMWARSYAHHLGHAHPGTASVGLALNLHLNPTPAELEEAAAEGRTIDVDARRYSTDLEPLGDFPCEGSPSAP